MTGLFDGADVMSVYSRAQAIEDGVLIDVTPQAAGQFRIPVALTTAVWADCVAWSDGDTARTGAPQDEIGRLHDVLWMTWLAVKRADDDADRIQVVMYRIPHDGDHGAEPQPVTLEAVCSPGDEGEPVVTIQQPGED